jgi:multiple sugar transport system permease protein
MERRRAPGSSLAHLLLTVASILSLFPIFWMVSVSLRPNVDIFRIPPAWFPGEFTGEAYRQIMATPQHIRTFANSYFTALMVTLVSLCFATLGGYAFSRFQFRGTRIIQLLIIGTQMIPPISLVIPYFIMIVRLKLYNSYLGLILTYTAFVLPFSTLMLISYFNTIPQDLEEAAMVDGCTRVGALVRVVLPLMLPGVAATGVYAFLLAWNEFLFAVTLTQSPDMRLVPVAIAMLMGEHAYQWNVMMALSVLASAPLLVMFLFLQRYLVSGLTVGAVKG